MHAENAGIIPADPFFFNGFGFHGIWEIDISTGFHGTGTENHGISDISTGNVRTIAEYQDLFGNCLDENGKSSFLRELFGRDQWNGGKTFPVQSRGHCPEQGAAINSVAPSLQR